MDETMAKVQVIAEICSPRLSTAIVRKCVVFTSLLWEEKRKTKPFQNRYNGQSTKAGTRVVGLLGLYQEKSKSTTVPPLQRGQQLGCCRCGRLAAKENVLLWATKERKAGTKLVVAGLEGLSSCLAAFEASRWLAL
jgi:hypothetical protein